VKRDKIFSMIGLAAKSHNLVSGEFMTESSVKEGKGRLVIIGSDVSENTRKKFYNMCSFYHVPLFEYGTKDTLGHAMGKEMRASLAITDAGFAESIKRLLEDNGGSLVDG